MTRFELGLEEPRRPRSSPVQRVDHCRSLCQRWASATLSLQGMTLLALFVFGYIKGRYTGAAPMRGDVQTLIIGALAAGAAFLIAKWIA
jgi:hypothetical protein